MHSNTTKYQCAAATAIVEKAFCTYIASTKLLVMRLRVTLPLMSDP